MAQTTPAPAPTASPLPRVTVLQSVLLGGSEISYMDHVAAQFGDDVVTVPFAYRAAVLGRWDILHVHWPEFLLRHGSWRKRAVRSVLFVAMLGRISWRRAPVVRTVHNLRPHDAGGWAERALLRALDRRVSAYVRLNPATEVRPGVRVVTVPHGHYRAQLQAESTPAPAGRLLFFGFIRPYKGVEELVEVFGRLPDPAARLTVAGKPATDGIRAAIEQAAAADPRVDASLVYLSDRDLAATIAAAAVVVLPYRDVHNSGVVLAALSAARPVLVVRNAATTALLDEFGPDWVTLFDPPLTPEHLSDALHRAADRPAGSEPDLSGRGWDEVARRYAELYHELAPTPPRRT